MRPSVRSGSSLRPIPEPTSKPRKSRTLRTPRPVAKAPARIRRPKCGASAKEDPMTPNELRPLLEALLFASDSPLTLSLLVETTGAEAIEVSNALETLREEFDRQDRGVQLSEI